MASVDRDRLPRRRRRKRRLRHRRTSERGPGTEVLLLEAGRDWRSAEAPIQVRSMNGWRALDESALRGSSSGRASSRVDRPRRSRGRTCAARAWADRRWSTA